MRRRASSAFGSGPVARPPLAHRPTLPQVRHVPPGWNDIRARIPMRPITCKEAGCDAYERTGRPCGVLHKAWNGQPPIFMVNGRPVVYDEFEQTVGEGVHTYNHLRTRGI